MPDEGLGARAALLPRSHFGERDGRSPGNERRGETPPRRPLQGALQGAGMEKGHRRDPRAPAPPPPPEVVRVRTMRLTPDLR